MGKIYLLLQVQPLPEDPGAIGVPLRLKKSHGAKVVLVIVAHVAVQPETVGQERTFFDQGIDKGPCQGHALIALHHGKVAEGMKHPVLVQLSRLHLGEADHRKKHQI